MKKKSTIAQIAEYCGVSPSTISRVFNGITYVAPDKREKIMRAAARFNYIPPAKAQRDTVALIVPEEQELYAPSFFAGMIICHLLQELSQNGYKISLCNSDVFSSLNPRIVAGGILCDWRNARKELKKVMYGKIPVVGINNFIAGMSCVCHDHAGQSMMAVKYLVREGHRKIVFIEPPLVNWGSSERWRGYRYCMEEEGIPWDGRFLEVWDREHKIDLEKFKTLIYECRPTAIICLHEDWMVQLHVLLEDLGLYPGRDISVITAEVPGLMDVLRPGYTAVAQDAGQLAKAAVAMIGDLKEKPPLMGGVMHYVLPCHIIKRKSVKTLK
jgi:DNA-binding LacI/PurR family transcriptional regulator